MISSLRNYHPFCNSLGSIIGFHVCIAISTWDPLNAYINILLILPLQCQNMQGCPQFISIMLYFFLVISIIGILQLLCRGFLNWRHCSINSQNTPNFVYSEVNVILASDLINMHHKLDNQSRMCIFLGYPRTLMVIYPSCRWRKVSAHLGMFSLGRRIFP